MSTDDRPMDVISALRLVHRHGARVTHGPETIVEALRGSPVAWVEVARSSDPLPFVDAVRRAARAEGWAL